MAILGFVAAPAAQAQLITLTPASVIGGSPVIDGSDNPVAFNSGTSVAQPGNIFNQQTGAVSSSGTFLSGILSAWEPAGNVGGAYLSLSNRFVTIDLGAAYTLTQFEIFNSTFSQRATATFGISASNSVTGASIEGGFLQGMTLSGTITTLLGSTALAYTNSQPTPVTGEVFAISDTNSYRYIQIMLLTATGDTQIFGSGLAEVRISGSAIPEPSTYAVIMGGVMLVGALVYRRCRGVPL